MGYISPTLAVRDMKKAIDFYTSALGFRVGMCFPDADNGYIRHSFVSVIRSKLLFR